MSTDYLKTLCFSSWLAILLLVQAQQCTDNFRHMHNMESVDGSKRGQITTIETRLIPSMRFTCSGTIVALIVTGRRQNGTHDPKLQIWREDKAQCGFYQKFVPDIVLRTTSCSNITHLVPESVFYCALKQSIHVSVQFGDILGIELPPTNDASFDLYFTDRGPVNYVFQQQLSSTVNTITKSSVVKEQPQITLDIISDSQCNIEYPMIGNGKARNTSESNTITRLIPDLKFTCDGIITQFILGGVPRPGAQDPKIQIWRESPNRCGAYFKPLPDILLNTNTCKKSIQVQPGDILGLELPPTDNESFKMHFNSGGPTNYVFPYQISFAVDLSSTEASVVQEQPQINITVEVLTVTSTSIEFDDDVTTFTMDMLPSHNTISVSVGVIIGISVVGGIAVFVLVILATSLVYVCVSKQVKHGSKKHNSMIIGYCPGNGMEIQLNRQVSVTNSISTEDNVAYGQLNVRVDNEYDTIPPADCPQ